MTDPDAGLSVWCMTMPEAHESQHRVCQMLLDEDPTRTCSCLGHTYREDPPMSELSDLRTWGAHAAEMAEARHRPDCPNRSYDPEGPARMPARICLGCVTDADRELWGRLAGEVAAHLAARQVDPFQEALL